MKGIFRSAIAHCITYVIKCGKSGSVEGLGESGEGFLSFFLSFFANQISRNVLHNKPFRAVQLHYTLIYSVRSSTDFRLI